MKKFLTFIFLLTALSFTNCNKVGCYDREMEANHSGFCPQDCPQVCGCDGKTYCNECIANSHGIEVDHDGPCQ